MKKGFGISFLVVLLLLAGTASATESYIPWLDYTLAVSYLDDEPIAGNDEARMVVMRFDSGDADIAYADFEANYRQFALEDEDGNRYTSGSWRLRGIENLDIRNFTPPDSLPSFELLFEVPAQYPTASLTLRTETAVEGETIINRLADLRRMAVSEDGTLVPAEGEVGEAAPAETAEATSEFALKKQASKEALRLLDNEYYAQTYDYLASGETLGNGSKDGAAKGLQQIMKDLGADITVDGDIGKKTMTALNDMRRVLSGAEDEIEAVTLDDFKDLLFYALMAEEEDTAYTLYSFMDGNALDYSAAALRQQMDHNYRAAQAFRSLGDYRDSAQRAEACQLPWPKNGEVYRNSDYKGSSAVLTIKTNQSDERATCIKIYSEDDRLVSVVFIGGSGKGKVKLPAGTYYMKSGVGTSWYGPGDAFGSDDEGAYYNRLRFGNEDDSVTLKKNYSYTLTLETDEEITGDSVGTAYESWDDF